jgi:hypothetical protein
VRGGRGRGTFEETRAGATEVVCCAMRLRWRRRWALQGRGDRGQRVGVLLVSCCCCCCCLPCSRLPCLQTEYVPGEHVSLVSLWSEEMLGRNAGRRWGEEAERWREEGEAVSDILCLE